MDILSTIIQSITSWPAATVAIVYILCHYHLSYRKMKYGAYKGIDPKFCVQCEKKTCINQSMPGQEREIWKCIFTILMDVVSNPFFVIISIYHSQITTIKPRPQIVLQKVNLAQIQRDTRFSFP